MAYGNHGRLSQITNTLGVSDSVAYWGIQVKPVKRQSLFIGKVIVNPWIWKLCRSLPKKHFLPLDRRWMDKSRLCDVQWASPKIKLNGGCETPSQHTRFGPTHFFLSWFFTYSTRDKGIRNSPIGGACLHLRKTITWWTTMHTTCALSFNSSSGGFPVNREIEWFRSTSPRVSSCILFIPPDWLGHPAPAGPSYQSPVKWSLVRPAGASECLARCHSLWPALHWAPTPDL